MTQSDLRQQCVFSANVDEFTPRLGLRRDNNDSGPHTYRRPHVIGEIGEIPPPLTSRRSPKFTIDREQKSLELKTNESSESK